MTDRRPSPTAVRSSCAAAPCSPWTTPHGAHRTPTCWSSATGSPRSGRASTVPEGTREIDASGGIVMPGMIDTHRHMWQTAMRGVRRRLDADPVLRLVLPRARQDVPPRGHPRRQPALRLGVARGRRHHHRRLVARAADRRPRRRRGRRAAGGARPVRAGLRQHPGRPVGVDRRPGGPRLLRAPPHRRRRPARLPAGLRRDRRPGVPGEGGVRGGPRARAAGDHPRRRLGRDQRRRHPADARERLHDARRPSTCTRPR